MKTHETELKGRTIRYYDPYDAGHLGAFADAASRGRLCVVVGPTGIGKTEFLNFACASCFSCENHNVIAYQKRYGYADAAASANHVLRMARCLRPDERLTVAFYPRPEEEAAQTGSDTWLETRDAITALIHGLSADGLRDRLVAIELSVEREFGERYNDICQFVTDSDWCLIEFGDWDDSMKLGYVDFGFKM